MNDDAISRSSTLEHVQRLDHLATLPDGDFVVRLSEVEDAIINGLPAQPQRMRGRWIPHKPKFCGEDEKVYTCDQCGHNIGFHTENFCPNCGSYNGGEQDEA